VVLLHVLRSRRATLTEEMAAWRQPRKTGNSGDNSDSDENSDNGNPLATVTGPAGVAGFRAGGTEPAAVSVEARRRWRILLLLVAAVAVPLIFDGIVVCCLQAVPRNQSLVAGEFLPALTAVVLPLLPLGVAVASALLTPLGFLLFAHRSHRALASRFAAPALALLLVPQALAQVGFAVVDWQVFNAHLWAYSTSSGDVGQAVDVVTGLSPGQGGQYLLWLAFSRAAPGFALVSAGSAVFWCCRLGALAVIVVGVDRVRRSVGLARIAPLLVVQAMVWVLAGALDHPDFVRGLVDVTVGITVLLFASLSERAFDT
jgi:hypothetical protein